MPVFQHGVERLGRWLAKSGTKNPYREGPIGIIEVGAYADMILVDGNPLDDVSMLADYDAMLENWCIGGRSRTADEIDGDGHDRHEFYERRNG